MILHITTDTAWTEAQERGAYEADSLATEGFIHCSTPGQVIWVANQRFRGRRDLLLLHVDEARLQAPIRYENLEGGEQLFPHVYGPLNLDAVVGATRFEPGPDGSFGAHGDAFTLQQTAHAIAGAIARRDAGLLSGTLAADFVYRGDEGRTTSDADAFLDGIRSIPGNIVFVRLESVTVDAAGGAALLTGVQHARVEIDGQSVDDRRGFADFFVKIDGAWKLRAAADFPIAASTVGSG